MNEIEGALAEAISETRHLGAQLHVLFRGEVVYDVAAGVREDGDPLRVDDLMVWFSAGKPLVASAVCRLWQQGVLDLDKPVGWYISHFGERGKDGITCRHLLAHCGGRLVVSDPAGVAAPFSVDYEPALAAALSGQLMPGDTPGAQSSYSSSTLSWLVLSAMIRRIDGRRFDAYVAQEICEPLGISCHYGFSAAELDELGGRVMSYRRQRTAMYFQDADAEEGAAIGRVLASGSFHRSLDPAAGLWASARDIGRFGEFLRRRLTGAVVDGAPLTTVTVSEMTTPQRPSLFEEAPLIDFGLGLTLETRRHGEEYAYFGSYCGQATFGHQGHGAPMWYVDPAYELVVAFNGNGLPGRVIGKLIWRRISDAIYAELGFSDSRAPVVPRMPTRDRYIDLSPGA